MAPAFGQVEVKGLLPYFADTATKACELRLYLILSADSGFPYQTADKWSNIIANDKSGHSATIDVSMWFGKATLDACVFVPVLDVRWVRTDREPTSPKDRCWSLRVRLRRHRRD